QLCAQARRFRRVCGGGASAGPLLAHHQRAAAGRPPPLKQQEQGPPMSKPLRVLIVEDNEQDAALLLRELKRASYDLTAERVDTPEAMNGALEKQPWDIVLSDFTMPRFSGPAALSMVREKSLDLPFIIVSGTVGEEAAVASLRAGAQDFLVKGSLARLIPAIERELRE